MTDDIGITINDRVLEITTKTLEALDWLRLHAYRYGIVFRKDSDRRYDLRLWSHINPETTRDTLLAFNMHGGALQGWSNDVTIEQDCSISVDERGILQVCASGDGEYVSYSEFITFHHLLTKLGVSPKTASRATYEAITDIQKRKEQNG